VSRPSRLVDMLLLLAVFTITLVRVRWTIAGNYLYLSDLTVGFFTAAFLFDRIARWDWRIPRVSAVLALFLAAFALVYLAGFFNLETSVDRNQFVKGLAKFALHFVFVIAAVAHLARRTEGFYWRTLTAFLLGIAANAAYGLLEVAVAFTSGRFLDPILLNPLTGETGKEGVAPFGVINGVDVYRANGLMLDTNHLGVVLIIPLLVLLPIYLRLESDHPLRVPLVLLLSLLTVAELATLSRSGALGLIVGLLVLALPYRRLLLTRRLLVPLGAVGAVLFLFALRYSDFSTTLLRARTSLGGRGTQTHFDLYELVPSAFDAHPLLGRGLNTFSVYFEFLTGRTNWGPHSYYIALLVETGIVGTVLFLAFLVYVFRRLRAFRRLGVRMAAVGESAAARVRPLAWGFTAALAGTLAANAFYLTMQMFYFFVFVMLAVAAPLVFARRLSP
jgi:O-Antigen ligase